MNKLIFYCFRCDKKQPIDVSTKNSNYIVGYCSICKTNIVINLKKGQGKRISGKKLDRALMDRGVS